jgi:hypothetical protein
VASFDVIAEKAVNLLMELTSEESLDSIKQELNSSMRRFSISQDADFDWVSDGPGIYLIELRFPHACQNRYLDFISAWGVAKAADCPPSVPRASVRRAKQHIDRLNSGDFIPLYLGKSLNVRGRLRQHVLGNKASRTYGLKLLSRPDLLNGCELRSGAVPFNRTPDAYFCVGLLEAALRKRIHPIVGKQ